MSMFIKKMSFFFQRFDQIKLLIDVLLASALYDHVALLQLYHLIIDCSDHRLLHAFVHQVWFSQNTCRYEFCLYSYQRFILLFHQSRKREQCMWQYLPRVLCPVESTLDAICSASVVAMSMFAGTTTKLMVSCLLMNFSITSFICYRKTTLVMLKG